MVFNKGLIDTRTSGRQDAPHDRGRSRWVTVLAVVAMVATLGLGLVGCSDGSSGFSLTGLPIGNWVDEWDNEYVITRTSVSLYGSDGGNSYIGWIVYIDDGSLNGDDTSITATGSSAVNPGFAVIRYATVSNASWGEVGKYNVFRWADGTASNQRLMTQGGKYNEDFTEMTVFDSRQEAINGATNEEGFFGFAGEYTWQ